MHLNNLKRKRHAAYTQSLHTKDCMMCLSHDATARLVGSKEHSAIVCCLQVPPLTPDPITLAGDAPQAMPHIVQWQYPPSPPLPFPSLSHPPPILLPSPPSPHSGIPPFACQSLTARMAIPILPFSHPQPPSPPQWTAHTMQYFAFCHASDANGVCQVANQAFLASYTAILLWTNHLRWHCTQGMADHPSW
eukprot:GGOE01053147.1.p1 GENE.GGOE01053147.1~~GGOE01053147.1.p1  ORF type:complete len:191 (-),score=11.23 GGOE01053147.1:282-854(-)